jgi:uncharacterized membrane protein
MAKRNRIVIDLQKARTEGQGRVRAGRSGRVGRILGIIAVVLVVIIIGAAAGGYFWWRHYQTQPAYSIALLVDASQRKDTAEIDRLLDMDKITSDFLAQVQARVPAAAQSASQGDSLIATLTPKLKPTVRDELIKEVRRVTERANGKPFSLIALAVPFLVTVKQDGKAATAEMKFQDEEIRLTMQAEADSWRIVAMQDDKLADIVADHVKKALPKSPSQWQDVLERQLKGINVPNPTQ